MNYPIADHLHATTAHGPELTAAELATRRQDVLSDKAVLRTFDSEPKSYGPNAIPLGASYTIKPLKPRRRLFFSFGPPDEPGFRYYT